MIYWQVLVVCDKFCQCACVGFCWGTALVELCELTFASKVQVLLLVFSQMAVLCSGLHIGVCIQTIKQPKPKDWEGDCILL